MDFMRVITCKCLNGMVMWHTLILFSLRFSLAAACCYTHLTNPQYPDYISSCSTSQERSCCIQKIAHEIMLIYGNRLQKDRVLIHVTRTGDGGLGDRLRGMVTSFYIALATDRLFLIDEDEARSLKLGFKPSHQYLEHATSVNLTQKQSPLMESFIDASMLNIDFQKRWSGHDVVRLRTNAFIWRDIINQSGAYKGILLGLSTFDMFRVAFFLMCNQPSHQVTESIKNYMSAFNPGSMKIGVHMRLGGSWGDAVRVPAQYISSFAKRVADICNGTCVVYIATDNKEAQLSFKNMVALYGKNITLVAPSHDIVHIDRNSQAHTQDAILGVFIDWHLLRLMDYLVISRSGFSQTASWASMTPTDVFVESKFVRYDNIIGFKGHP